MNNGISPKAPAKEKIESDFESLIRGMYELGKKEATTWHPYPEETPQSGDNYLVTVIDQTDHKTRYVGTALFLNVTGWNVSSRYRVIAWANLPEPDSRTVE